MTWNTFWQIFFMKYFQIQHSCTISNASKPNINTAQQFCKVCYVGAFLWVTYFSYLQNIHHATMQGKCVYNMDRCIVLSTVTSFLKFCRSFLVYVYIVVTYKNINFCRVISSDAHAHSCRSRSCEVLFVGRKHPNIWYPQCSSIYWMDYIYIYNSLLYYLMDIVSWNDYYDCDWSMGNLF